MRFHERAFDSHAGQWTWAAHGTGITTPWVLALDCDYMVTAEVRAEMDALPSDTPLNGWWCPFRYAIMGKVLRSGIYPPVQALYRRSAARYFQDGHTHRAVIEGPVGRLAAPMIHDDRKPLDHWIRSQFRYAQLEADKLSAGQGGLKAWLRTRTPFAAIVVAFYCLFIRGAAFEGKAGWLYALQRTLAEAMIGCAWYDAALRRV